MDDKSALAPLRGIITRRVLRSLPGVPYPAASYALRHDHAVRSLIREASVIVLQWQREAGQSSVFRSLAPNATIVSVLHDVDSQGIQRRTQAELQWSKRAINRLRLTAARWAERRVLAKSDVTLVLSQKDAQLLSDHRHRVTVIPPPIASPNVPVRHPIPGRITFVAGGRPENTDALSWFAGEVLPCVDQSLIHEVCVVGRVAESARMLCEANGFRPLGFVEDLATIYATTALVVVPLRLGAGVKFKTLEAVLHGVPVVTTSVGAEGIVGLESTAHVTDSPEDFAARLESLLRDSERAEQEAAQLLKRVLPHHGAEAFESAMSRLDSLLAKKASG